MRETDWATELRFDPQKNSPSNVAKVCFKRPQRQLSINFERSRGSVVVVSKRLTRKGSRRSFKVKGRQSARDSMPVMLLLLVSAKTRGQSDRWLQVPVPACRVSTKLYKITSMQEATKR